MEQELAAGLGEGQIAEFVEDDEVHAGQMFGEPTLQAVASLGLEPVDEIHHVVEPATDPERMQLLAMAMARWVLPVPVPPTSTALRCWAEVTTGEITHERLVDGRTLELQVVEVLGGAAGPDVVVGINIGRVFYLDAPL